MERDGELVYRRGKFYKSEVRNCLTNESGFKNHYWEETPLDKYFVLWNGKQHRIYRECHQKKKKQ